MSEDRSEIQAFTTAGRHDFGGIEDEGKLKMVDSVARHRSGKQCGSRAGIFPRSSPDLAIVRHEFYFCLLLSPHRKIEF